jgi:Fe-S cluster biosynthesis and repair protein YggX
MTAFQVTFAAGLVLFERGEMARGVELTVSRQALERTLKQQLFAAVLQLAWCFWHRSGWLLLNEKKHLAVAASPLSRIRHAVFHFGV